MPGIAGIIGAKNPDSSLRSLRRMIKSMMHEPFYRSGDYAQEALGLCVGWASSANSFDDCMPIWNESKDICLIFAGEDFSDRAEIERLKRRGHSFNAGNASYLVHLYEEASLGFIEKLNGRFCGLLTDSRKNLTVLFNDRYGFGRIYYHDGADGFYFASEAKALLKLVPDLRKVDRVGLGEYFSCGCTLQNRTLFSGISLLPGASAWMYAPGQKIEKKSYFQKETWEAQTPLEIGEYYQALKETWVRILPRYLQGNERMALSLTGGKDSRMIMAWLPQTAGQLPCYTFSSIYREPEDVKIARRIAAICHQPHQTIVVGEEFFTQFPALAERTIYLTDGVMDVSGAPDLYTNQLARQIAPIRLTGNYGQEILRGVIAFRPVSLFPKIFHPGFVPYIQNARQTYFSELGSNPISFVAFKQIPWHHFSRLSLESSQLTLRSPYLDNDLVRLSFRLPAQLADFIEPQLWLIAQGNAEMESIGTDRGSRWRPTPVLSSLQHFVKEFTFKAEYAYDYGMPPWLVKIDGALSRLRLERHFLGRHKFYHFRIWYRDQFSDFIRSVLLDSRALSRSYLDKTQVEKIVIAHTTGAGNYTAEIHRLLSIELMHRTLIENV